MPEANPGQQIAQIVVTDLAVRNRQRQRDIGGERQVVEKAAILMHDADAAADVGDLVARETLHLAVKDRDMPCCGQKFGVAQFQER